MRIAFFILLLALRGLAVASVVDVYLDMENGSANASVNTNLLNAATHGVGGSWSTIRGTQAAPLTAMKVTTDFDPLLGTPVEVGTNTYTDGRTSSGYVFRNSTDREFARYTFDITHSRVSVGCFVRIGDFDGSTFGSYDLIAMEGDGEFLVLNFQDFPGKDFVWQIHTQSGTHDPILVAPNMTYWVSLLWDQSARRAYLKMYDASTWELLGSSSIRMENKPCEAVCFGRYDDHGVTSPANHYFDDLMIDYSAADFPILPARIGPATASISLTTEGSGTISGASDNSILDIDRIYTLTARPSSGNLFAGWTGSTSSPDATLKFAMTTNTSFTAHFVTNPFPEFKGTYAGLFYDASVSRSICGKCSVSGVWTRTMADDSSFNVSPTFDPMPTR